MAEPIVGAREANQQFSTLLAAAEREGIIVVIRPCLETSIVLYRVGEPEAVRYLNHFIVETRIAPIPFTTDISKFRGRPRALWEARGIRRNYALAKISKAPLLFKGGDFSHTDVVFAC